MEVRITKSSVSMGSGVMKILDKPSVEVYLDRDKNLVGLKASSDEIKGFRISKKNERYSSLAGSFKKAIPIGHYKGIVADGMVVFQVEKLIETHLVETVKV